MASAACARSIARSSIISSRSRSFMGATLKRTIVGPSSNATHIRSPLQNLSRISRLSRMLASVDSLMPQHNATAVALMTSLLSVRSRSWGPLSEGFATPV